MIFENYDRIVFAGDSVTDMGSLQPVGEGLADNIIRNFISELPTQGYREIQAATFWDGLNVMLYH